MNSIDPSSSELSERVRVAKAALTLADHARDRVVAIPPEALTPVLTALYREAARRLEPIAPQSELATFEGVLDSGPDASGALLAPNDWDTLRASLERTLVHAERLSKPELTLQQQAWRRVALGAAVTLAVIGLFWWLLSPSDLAEHAPYRTSSSWAECKPAEHLCGGSYTHIFFHTQEEENPWIEYDLGVERRIVSVVVQNRDMLKERAVPLVLEVSSDQKQYRELRRTTDEFETWRVGFPPERARYVRLRAARRTMLHFEGVHIYGS